MININSNIIIIIIIKNNNNINICITYRLNPLYYRCKSICKNSYVMLIFHTYTNSYVMLILYTDYVIS